MSYKVTMISSHIRLPRQKQDAILTHLNEAISSDPWMKAQAELFLYDYQKHGGDGPLSFSAILELWGWKPTFDQTTGDLVALTNLYTEREDERTLQLFFDLLAPGLDDEDFVELEINHERCRYVSFQGKMYRLDARYVYPSLPKTVLQAQELRVPQGEQSETQVTPYHDYLDRPIRVGDVIAGVKNGQIMVAVVRGWTEKSLHIDELLRDEHYDRGQGRFIFIGVRLWRTFLRLPQCCFVTGQTEEQIRQQFACREVISRYG